MIDIAKWLSDLNLGQYASVFAENAIDAELLPKLNDNDLKELGVKALGHRKRLLEAITQLSVDPPMPPVADCATPVAERRQLTVLFCDLVGSTELSGRLDPEDLAEVLRQYQEICRTNIERWGGHIARFLGDGVLAYFGFPTAHEEDAERSIRAGLDLTDAVAQLTASNGQHMAAKVGIATGLVVVGELIGEGVSQEESVVGETPNLAARLEALAKPGAVVIAPQTKQLVGDRFEIEDLGMHTLKGFASPLQTWRVQSAKSEQSRFDARMNVGLTSLVGRSHDLAMLEDLWHRAEAGDGQVALISGEPGVGKSRLMQTLRERLEDQPYLCIRHQCSPFHVNSALHPIIQQLMWATKMTSDDSVDEKLNKLEGLLGDGQCDEAAALLANLLSLPSDRYPHLGLSPHRQKERTKEVLVEHFAGLAKQGPILHLFEDLHWIDPTTLELLDRLIESVEVLPILAIFTFRPEFVPSWVGQGHVRMVQLNRLPRRLCAAMIEQISGEKTLPAEVLRQIVEKADGVPLFIEELTKAVLESDLMNDVSDPLSIDRRQPNLSIPNSLQESLLSRLDRLESAKEIAQIGAVIGREFSHKMIAEIWEFDEASLRQAAEKLANSELVTRRGQAPDVTYIFKHALIQDAAYSSLLKTRRLTYHAKLATSLVERFDGVAADQAALLGHHFGRAGKAAEAIAYLTMAGRRLLEQSSPSEAIGHLRMALSLIDDGADLDDPIVTELDVLLTLGKAVIASTSYASSEARKIYERARELCDPAKHQDYFLQAIAGQFAFYLSRGQYESAEVVAHEMSKLNDRNATILGLRGLGSCAYHTGRLLEARARFENMLEISDFETGRNLGPRYAIDPHMSGVLWLGTVLFALGYPSSGLARIEEGVTYTKNLAYLHGQGFALVAACFFDHQSGNFEKLSMRSKAAVALANEQGFQYLGCIATMLRAVVLAEFGDADDAVALFDNGFRDWEATEAGIMRAYYHGLKAEILRKAGRITDAQAMTAIGLADAQKFNDLWYVAELRRLAAALSNQQGLTAQAEASLTKALEIARVQDAKFWELRAARDLAQCWSKQGKQKSAHALLAPVYEWFTEGLDTQELIEVKKLLESLCSA